MKKLKKVKAGGKVHLTYGINNRALCEQAPPFEVLVKGTVTCAKCKKVKNG